MAIVDETKLQRRTACGLGWFSSSRLSIGRQARYRQYHQTWFKAYPMDTGWGCSGHSSDKWIQAEEILPKGSG